MNGGGSRRVLRDDSAVEVLVQLAGIDLGAFDKGAVPVDLTVNLGELVCADTLVAACSGKSLRY